MNQRDLTTFISDRKERKKSEAEKIDPRQAAGSKFYDDTSIGIHINALYKTTRAGATTGLSRESIERNELLTLVCRTNLNIIEAVQKDTQSIVSHPVNIIHIAANSFCPRIIELTKEFPAIKKLSFIPLPDCDTCDVSKCVVKAGFETPPDKVNAYSFTFHKLMSMMASESKKVKDLLENVFQSRNIIFDEVQFLQEMASPSAILWERREGRESSLNLECFKILCDSSPMLQRVMTHIKNVINGVQQEIEKLKKEAITNHDLKHLAIPVVNPELVKFNERYKKLHENQAKEKEDLQKLYPHKSWLELSLMLSNASAVNNFMEDLTKGKLEFQEVIKVQGILINAIKNPEKYNITEDQIIVLSKLINITNADELAVSFVKGSDGEQISINALDTMFYDSLRRFLQQLLIRKQDKRIIFTSATFGSINLEKLLGIKKIENYVWGDPLCTNEKFLVVADTSRLSNFNFGKKLGKIKEFNSLIKKRYGAENVNLCAMSKKMAKAIGNDCTWYASDRTEGVPSSKRIWIFFGLAEKPVNAKDTAAIVQFPYHDIPIEIAEEKRYYYLSQKLKNESVQITTKQALSRAKDPHSKNRGIAIMVGARKEEVEQCLLWGIDRKLSETWTDKGLKFSVDVKNPIGKPRLTEAPLSLNVEESLHIIDQWITSGEVESYKLNWVYFKNIIDSKGYLSIKGLVKINGADEAEARRFFASLPEYFEKQGITGYVLVHNAQSEVKGVATRLYFEGKKKTGFITKTQRVEGSTVQSTDWFNAIKAAVDRAPDELINLTPRFFSQHISSSTYAHLNEFMDNLELNPHLCPGWIVVGKKNDNRNNRRLTKDIPCLGAWAPDFPRNFGNPQQCLVNSTTELLDLAYDSFKSKSDCFVSVYAFPDKHPKEGGNPSVSTIFIDIDVESQEFSDLKKRWDQHNLSVREDLKALRLTLMDEVLKQAKGVVAYLKARGIEPRILLSGYKGVHMFIDFPSVQFSSPQTAKEIIKKFLEQIAEEASKGCGSKVVFDPSVIGDLSRLCRIPNTHNSKATKVLGRDQYAVPVTSEELMNLTPSDYDKLCSASRYVIVERKESMAALEMLTKISEEIDLEDEDSTVKPAITPKVATKNPEKLKVYEQECRREILSDKDFDELDMRPCFIRVHKEKISLNGGGGHIMRMGGAMELAKQNLSIPSIARWFAFCNDYNPSVSEKCTVDLISRGYMDKHVDEDGSERRKGMTCKKILESGFCLNDDCRIYQKKFGGR